MNTGADADSQLDGDPCVAEFLARHGIANKGEQATQQQQQQQPSSSPTDTHIFDGPAEQTIELDRSMEQKLGLATSGIKAVNKSFGDATEAIAPTPAQPPSAAPERPPQPPRNAASQAAAAVKAPQPPQPPAAVATPATPAAAAARSMSQQIPARRKREVADQKSADAMRQLRSVANSISVSISRSNQVKEKLNEAARFLAISLIAGLAALGLAFFTSTAQSFIFFAAMITLVLGLLCAYRTTMIMTRLRRVAKL